MRWVVLIVLTWLAIDDDAGLLNVSYPIFVCLEAPDLLSTVVRWSPASMGFILVGVKRSIGVRRATCKK